MDVVATECDVIGAGIGAASEFCPSPAPNFPDASVVFDMLLDKDSTGGEYWVPASTVRLFGEGACNAEAEVDEDC